MLQLLVKTKPGSLLELLVASLEVACVWMILCMSIDVLRQILFLSEVPSADITHKPLETHVERDQVSLETEPRGEVRPTVRHGADKRVGLVAFGLLGLYHLVEDVP